MDKNEIIKILYDWNFWQRDINTGIERKTYIAKLDQFLNSGFITVIAGPRRSGKSFIMRQYAKKLIESGINKNDILVINFEDPRFVGLDV